LSSVLLSKKCSDKCVLVGQFGCRTTAIRKAWTLEKKTFDPNWHMHLCRYDVPNFERHCFQQESSIVAGQFPSSKFFLQILVGSWPYLAVKISRH
jgi:hypothetical protein